MLDAGMGRHNGKPGADPPDVEARRIACNPGLSFDEKRRGIAFGLPEYPGRETIPVRCFCESEAPIPAASGEARR